MDLPIDRYTYTYAILTPTSSRQTPIELPFNGYLLVHGRGFGTRLLYVQHTVFSETQCRFHDHSLERSFPFSRSVSRSSILSVSDQAVDRSNVSKVAVLAEPIFSRLWRLEGSPMRSYTMAVCLGLNTDGSFMAGQVRDGKLYNFDLTS